MGLGLGQGWGWGCAWAVSVAPEASRRCGAVPAGPLCPGLLRGSGSWRCTRTVCGRWSAAWRRGIGR